MLSRTTITYCFLCDFHMISHTFKYYSSLPVNDAKNKAVETLLDILTTDIEISSIVNEVI